METITFCSPYGCTTGARYPDWAIASVGKGGDSTAEGILAEATAEEGATLESAGYWGVS